MRRSRRHVRGPCGAQRLDSGEGSPAGTTVVVEEGPGHDTETVDVPVAPSGQVVPGRPFHGREERRAPPGVKTHSSARTRHYSCRQRDPVDTFRRRGLRYVSSVGYGRNRHCATNRPIPCRYPGPRRTRLGSRLHSLSTLRRPLW